MSSNLSRIEQILNMIAWYADHENSDGAAEYYTENPIIEVDYNGSSAKAAAALRRLSETGDYAIRHVNSNLVILEEKADSLRAANIVTAYLHAGPGPYPANPTLIADLTYDFVRGQTGDWLISRQVARFVLGGIDALPGAS